MQRKKTAASIYSHGEPLSKGTSRRTSFYNPRSNRGTLTKKGLSKMKYIIKIQRCWKRYYQNIILKKIILIQKFYRGFNIRKIFYDIRILNKKLECFIFIIKITMYRHSINFDYSAHKRIEYYTNHKKAKNFLLLQKRIKYFLFKKKADILVSEGLFDDIYIKNFEFRPKIKSKMTKDVNGAIPVIKFHRPISKIIMIQRNYKRHLKYIRQIPKYTINKIFLNENPLIYKLYRPRPKINYLELYNNARKRAINPKHSFFEKVNYDYTPLIYLQRKYKERYKYLEENYKLKKHERLRKSIVNKHSYVYHCKVNNKIEQVYTLQKNIKYFLFRIHSQVNLIKKFPIKKCRMSKSKIYKRELIACFYENFSEKLILIITNFFLRKYFNIFIREIRKLNSNYYGSKYKNYNNLNSSRYDNASRNDSNRKKNDVSISSNSSGVKGMKLIGVIKNASRISEKGRSLRQSKEKNQGRSSSKGNTMFNIDNKKKNSGSSYNNINYSKTSKKVSFKGENTGKASSVYSNERDSISSNEISESKNFSPGIKRKESKMSNKSSKTFKKNDSKYLK